jgi:RND superfamily putative drug exporter
MATLLYRLGRFGFRRRGSVLTAWLLLLAVLGGILAAAGTAPSSSIAIPGTESQRALDALAEEFPQASGASGTVAVRAPAGESVADRDNREIVLGVVQEAKAWELPACPGARG